MSKTFAALLLLGLVGLGTATPLAQSITGAITGTVKDDMGGGTVPEGSIQAKRVGTGAVATAPIAAGAYTVERLPPGTYDLSIDRVGRFEPFSQKSVVVESGRTVRVDITLRGYGGLADNLGEVAELLRAKPVPTGPTPRMPNGKPDLSGIWLNITEGNPAAPLPLQPWAKKIQQERQDKQFPPSPQALCQPSSPIQMIGSFPYMFVQTATILVMLREYDVAMVRQIFLDGHPHPDLETGKMGGSRAWNPSWLGHSVGQWEGETLVVDTVGFNDRSWLQSAPHTEQLHLVERFRRPDFGHLEIDVTAEDPGAFTAPWKHHLIGTIAAKDEEILEFICNEDNIDLQHIVGTQK